MDHGKEDFAVYPTSTFQLKVRFYDSPVKKNLWNGSKQNLVRFMEAWTVSKKFFKASLKDAELWNGSKKTTSKVYRKDIYFYKKV